jgi:hypothetical protein
MVILFKYLILAQTNGKMLSCLQKKSAVKRKILHLRSSAIFYTNGQVGNINAIIQSLPANGQHDKARPRNGLCACCCSFYF